MYHSHLVYCGLLCQQTPEATYCDREALERLAEGLAAAEPVVLVCIAAQLLYLGDGDCLLKDPHVRHLAAGFGAWLDVD